MIIDRFVERLLFSLADAAFWIFIIVAVGLVGVYVFERIVDFLGSEIGGEGKEREDETE